MKKLYIGPIILLIFLTTYTPKFNSLINLNFNIKQIIIENNLILKSNEIEQKLNFLYKTNLLTLNTKKIEKKLKEITFVESFSIKKIYPNKLKIILTEKVPIAILQNKKKKFYISDKGALIIFRDLDFDYDFPIVFGNGNNFETLYKNLKKTNFPFKSIKSFYFFESGRWDLVTRDDKIIKLPNDNYLSSLKNFMNLKNKKNFNNHKIYDYRINDQLILK